MEYSLDSWQRSGARYREWLFQKGRELKDEEGKTLRKGVDDKEREQVFTAKGKMPLACELRQRISYFTTGLAIGSKSFITGIL